MNTHFPGSSAGKESTCNAGDPGSIPGLGRSAGEGKGYLVQYSGLENSMDCIVCGIPKSWTQLSNFHFHLGLPCGSTGKEYTCNAGDLGSIPGLERSPGEGKVYPLQYSSLENSMDYSPWGHKESDMTEQLSLSPHGIVLFTVLNLHITK